MAPPGLGDRRRVNSSGPWRITARSKGTVSDADWPRATTTGEMAIGSGRPLRTLIVDDEKAARDVLRRDLAAIEGIEVVGEAENGGEAQQRIDDLSPDLVLLDIQMPVKDGFDVVRGIRGPLPAIVFVTAYSEHALRAFEVGAVDYLLKPFSGSRLLQSIERARQARMDRRGSAERVARTLNADAGYGPRKVKVVACHGRDFLLIDLEQVYAFRASGEVIWIVTQDRRYRATQTLTALAKRLAGTQFLRVHRNVLINSDKISKISALSSRRWLLTLENGFQCIASKRNAGLVRTLLR